MHLLLKNTLIVVIAAGVHFGLLFGSAIAIFMFGNPLRFGPTEDDPIPLWESVLNGFTDVLSQPGSYVYENVLNYGGNHMIIAGFNSLLWGLALLPLVRFLLTKRRQRIENRMPAPNDA